MPGAGAYVDQLRGLRRGLRAGGQHRDNQPHFQDAVTWAATDWMSTRCPGLSARYRMTGQQRVFALCLLAGFSLLAIISFGHFLLVITIVSSLYFMALTGFRLLLFWLSLRQSTATAQSTALAGDALPMITVLCPMYDEADSLPHLVRSLRELDYPTDKLDIKIVLEADDDETRTAAVRHCEGKAFEIIIVPDGGPRTKPKACNHALWRALGELIVIYDAEDRPEPDQLRKAATAFHHGPDDLVCVQARLNYYNRDRTWLTRLFSIEYAVYFDIILPGLSHLNLPVPLGGTSNFFRTEALINVGGWDPYNVTEDADLGMRLAAAGYRCTVIDSTTFEEAVGTVGPWIRQRSRWIKGFVQTWLVHTRLPIWPPTRKTLKRLVSVHLMIGATLVNALFSPLLIILFILTATGVVGLPGHPWTNGFFSLAMLSFLAGNLTQYILHLLGPVERHWFHYAPWTLLLPVYGLLQWLAGLKSLIQLVRAPHYWEKTEHDPATRYADSQPGDKLPA